MKINGTRSLNTLQHIQRTSISQIFITLFLSCVLLLSLSNQKTANATDQALELTPDEIAWLNENKKNIRYAPNPNWPPGDYMENGEHKGIVSDYIKIFEKKLGITFKRVYYEDWETLYKGMMTGDFDLIGAVQETEDRKKVFVFTKPFLKTRLAVLMRANSPALNSLDDLNTMTLAGIKGYSSIDYVKTKYPGAKIIQCDDDLTVLLKVSAGAADGAIADYMIASYLIDKYSITNIRYAKELDFHWDLRFAINKKMPQLRSILNKVLSTISEDERQEIYHRWVSIRLENKPSFFERHIDIIIGIFSFILFLLLVVILFNLSLRKQVATHTKDLKESEERFRVLHNASFGGILIHDKGIILECNMGLSEITGYTYDELIGMNGLSLISEDTRDEARKNIEAGYEKPYEATGLRKDGALYPARIEARNLPFRGKDVRVVEFRDISEFKRAEKEREELELKLRQAQKMEAVGRLAGGVAHDFNNMLSVIIGNAEIALEQADLPRPLYDGLVEIRKAGERSANLTRQLLAFARKQTVSPTVLDLNTIVSEVTKMLKRLIGEDIDLALRLGKSVWPVKMDPSQIDQILANLCVNARDAIADVGKVTIETGNVEFDETYCHYHPGFLPGRYALLAVSDNGCGMDADTLDNVFEPFFTTKESGQGTGLGLATVYGIVKQNDGFINVYSEPGQGSTFKIYLPRYQARADSSPEKVKRPPITRGDETILLVEDEPAILKMTTRILEGLGYRVVAASSADEAIRIAQDYADDIHLLLTDVVMPEMNGRDLAKNILTLHPNLRRLFMSGYTANVIAHHGVLDEGVNFIQKPFSREQLGAKVREALDGGESILP